MTKRRVQGRGEGRERELERAGWGPGPGGRGGGDCVWGDERVGAESRKTLRKGGVRRVGSVREHEEEGRGGLRVRSCIGACSNGAPPAAGV